jgi:hypothetical protein
MAAIINRAFGSTSKADITKFSDVTSGQWYYEDMAKAVKMQTFVGDGDGLFPNRNITREEAFTVVARALKLEDATSITANLAKNFTDSSSVSSWAKGSVYAMINNGYVTGDGTNINPKSPISRQEFVVIFDRVAKNYISTKTAVTEVKKGNVMVNVPDATLKNLTISGDLIVGDGVGQGELTLDSVTVTGRVLVRGGGANSIIIKGNSKINKIDVFKVEGTVSVKVSGNATVETVNALDKSANINLEGSFINVNLSSDVIISAVNCTIQKATVVGKDSELIVGKGSVVITLTITKAATGSEVSGEGTVKTVKDEVTNENYTITEGKETAVVTDDTKTPSGTTTENTSSGGGSTSYTYALTLNNASPKLGDAVSVVLGPTNATVRYSWTVDGVVVSTASSYSPTVADLGKTITVTTIGTGDYSGSKTATTNPVNVSVSVNGEAKTVTGNNVTAALGDTLSSVVVDFGQAVTVDTSKVVMVKKGTVELPMGQLSQFTANSVQLVPGSLFTNASATGTFTITVPAGTVTDASNKVNPEFTFTVTVQ